MKKLLLFLCLILFGLSTMNGQYQKPPKITHKTVKYELPELIINNSLFMNELDSLIFNSNYVNVYGETDKYLRILITKDSIYVELSDICGNASLANKGIGYFKRNGLIYIIRGKDNYDLFAVCSNKKTFSYVATMWGNIDITEDDIPMWVFDYEGNQLTLKYHPRML